jgi:predicted metal-dependent phosphoesterase TrpH
LTKAALLSAIFFSFPAYVHAHGAAAVPPPDGRTIDFPDVPGYRTLVVDLHSHSVFSDGHVWPKIRIEEALRDGLDGFAVTEHLEWQPHLADIPHADRNRAYEISVDAAKDTDLIVIAGSEITRELPAGHINAVFIDDANALLKAPDGESDVRQYYARASEWPPEDAVAAANAQGAFVFFNHPDWPAQRPDGIAKLSGLQRKLVREDQVHGIEIANGQHYSPEAFRLALKHDLALIGVSDIHDLIDWDHPPAKGEHRPVTLVFAEERSAAGIKAGLEARRTVVWFRNTLMGREAVLQPLLEASLTMASARALPNTQVVEFVLKNTSDADMVLAYTGALSLALSTDRVTVPAHGETTLRVRPGSTIPQLSLAFTVDNALTAPGQSPSVTLRSSVEGWPASG